MSKMGDLIVRLKLQYEDYKKGLKKASADTNSFAGTLGKIKGVGLAVWGAIGAGATAMAKSFINHSQIMGDKWNIGVSQMKSVWSQFLTSLTNWDWEGFGNRIKDALDTAAKSTAAHDAEFEVTNAVKMRKAAMAEELAQLQILMRDTGKSYDERAKAAQEYLDKVKPLYDAEIELRKQIYLADTEQYLKNAGLQANTANRDLLRTFLTDIAPNSNLVAILNEYQKKVQGKKYNLSAADLKAIDAFYEQYGNKSGAALSVLAQYYQATNDEIATKVVDAIVNYDNSIALFAEETRRIQTLQNSALAQIAKETANSPAAELPIVRTPMDLPAVASAISANAVALETPGIATPNHWADYMAQGEEFMAWYEQMVERTAHMNMMLEDSIIQATSGGLQAFTDLLMGIEGADASDILAALLQPFASTATQLGSLLLAEGIGIKAFKESLKTLNPAVAIGAGVALIALGAALGSAIKSLGGGSGGGSTVTNGGYSSGSSANAQNYSSELTINIKGKLRGSDIVMSEENTKDKWNR
jgi:hypothetical protein